MKKKGILGAIVIALLCTGCVHKLNVVTTKVFFARPFWRKLQNIFGECCISKLAKIAKLLDTPIISRSCSIG